MTRDDIIRMAREALDTDKVDAWSNDFWVITQEEIERFAALVAAAEREACIQKIREELDQAERNSMRLEAQPGVRVSMIEAALDWMRARGGNVSDG
jgi:hypothetical protein